MERDYQNKMIGKYKVKDLKNLKNKCINKMNHLESSKKQTEETIVKIADILEIAKS